MTDADRLAQLEDERKALLSLLPSRPLPTIMLGEGPALRAAHAVWGQVAGVLGVDLPAATGCVSVTPADLHRALTDLPIHTTRETTP